MSTKIEFLTFAQITENIGGVADILMDCLSADDQLQLIGFAKQFSEVAKSNQLSRDQVIALCLSLAVEFMRLSPEYIATVGKSVEDIAVNPCHSQAVN